MLTIHSATARHITIERLGGSLAVYDENTGHKIGQCDLIHGFAHYTGAKGSAHEGLYVVIRDGVEGLRRALRDGVQQGRDDRNTFEGKTAEQWREQGGGGYGLRDAEGSVIHVREEI